MCPQSSTPCLRYGRCIPEDDRTERSRDEWLSDDEWVEPPTQERSQTQKRISPLTQAWRPQRRRDPRLIAGVLVAAVILVLATVVGVIALRDEPPETERRPTASTPSETNTQPSQPRLHLSERTLLGPGDQGPDVRRLQRALNQLDYDAGRADGVFGRRTTVALRRFQRDVGVTPDGIAGRRTLRALNRALER